MSVIAEPFSDISSSRPLSETTKCSQHVFAHVMDYSIPPSYTEATNREWLPLVAPYLENPSLCSACLVSRRWHDILTPQLWGHPSVHFGTEGDRAYAQGTLTRFIHILPLARVEVRRLTHTLYLYPVRSDFHDGPQYQWLRDVLNRLPNLQCLVVSGVPFFDHAALLALRDQSPTHAKPLSSQPLVFSLRLLIATKCINCTPASLRFVIPQFPGLVFLDLSRNAAARDDNLLAAIGSLPDLQILKLRGIGLRDHDLRILAGSLNPKQDGLPAARHAYRLRSLDIRDNLLTDESVRIIVSRLIHHDSVSNIGMQQVLGVHEGHALHGSSLLALQTKQLLQQVDLDRHFIRNLSNTDVGYGILQDLDRVGVTHLLLANNPISMNSLINLVKAKNLHVLDIGTLKNGIDLLLYPLEDNEESSLTYLRIDHTLVTAPTRIITQAAIAENTRESQPSDLHKDHSAPPSNVASEACSDHATGSDKDLPSYEQSAKASVQAESSIKSASDRGLRQENNETLEPDPLPLYVESSDSAIQKSSPQALYPRSNLAGNGPLDSPFNNVSYDTPSEVQQIIDQRFSIRRRSRLDPRRVLPGQISTIQTLVLTSLPAFTRSAHLIQNLQDFITDCAMEHHLATEQARIEISLRRLHGISQKEAIQQRSRELFALQKIVIELMPQRSDNSSGAEILSSPSSPVINSRSRTWSSVDDHDVDTFWEAAKDDFSFFDEEQSAYSDIRYSAQLSQSPITEKSTNTFSDNNGSVITKYRETKTVAQPLRDIVAEIARWRAEKRMQHEATQGNTFVPGAWAGKVEVVRPGGKDLKDEMYDYVKSFELNGVFQ